MENNKCARGHTKNVSKVRLKKFVFKLKFVIKILFVLMLDTARCINANTKEVSVRIINLYNERYIQRRYSPELIQSGLYD